MKERMRMRKGGESGVERTVVGNNKRKKKKVVTYKKNKGTGQRRRMESFGREGFMWGLRIRGGKG